MPQFSEDVDRELTSLSREMAIAKATEQAAIAAYDKAWDRTKVLFNDHGKTRFICEDGFYLTVQARSGTPKLDEDKLKEVIFDVLDEEAAKMTWESITEPKVDPAKLEAAVAMGVIPSSLLDDCLTPGTSTIARVRAVWTAQDEMNARVLGIERKI